MINPQEYAGKLFQNCIQGTWTDEKLTINLEQENYSWHVYLLLEACRQRVGLTIFLCTYIFIEFEQEHDHWGHCFIDCTTTINKQKSHK